MSAWINGLASLLDWLLAFAVDWLAGQYEKDRREVDRRDVERAGQQAALEAQRKAAAVAAANHHAEAERLAQARANVTYAEGASAEDLADASNRELN